MSGEALEKYAVQFFLKDKWIERSTYAVEERSDAVKEAMIIGRRLENTPVRVLLDRFNPLSRVHTQTLIFRNEVKEPNEARIARLQRLHADRADRTPVSLWGYLGLMLNVLLIGIIAAGLSVLIVELMMQGFDVHFVSEFRYGFLLLIFGLVFSISTYSSFQSYQEQYVFAGWKKKSAQKREPILSAKQRRLQEKADKENAEISQTMKIAAREIDKSPPVFDSAREEMDELDRYYFPVVESVEETKVQKKPSYKVFFNSFLSDCLHGMQTHDMTVTARNRFGLQIYMKAVIDEIAAQNHISTTEQDQFQTETLALLDCRDNERLDFLQDYLALREETPHKELISKAKQTAIRADYGDKESAQNMFKDLDMWVKGLEAEEQKHVFILSIEPLGELNEGIKQAFQSYTQSLFTHFNAVLLEHPRQGWLVQFAQKEDACGAAIDLQKYCQDHESQIALQMGLSVTNALKKEYTFACNLSVFANLQTIILDKNMIDQFDENSPYTFNPLSAQSLNLEEHAFELYQLDWKAEPKVKAKHLPEEQKDSFESLTFKAG